MSGERCVCGQPVYEHGPPSVITMGCAEYRPAPAPSSPDARVAAVVAAARGICHDVACLICGYTAAECDADLPPDEPPCPGKPLRAALAALEEGVKRGR